MATTKNLFISYGRRESLGFVARLHQALKLKNYAIWFDKVNIPDASAFDKEIQYGIESADNFAFVMAPRSMTSVYCLKELEYARWLGKRVIPIQHVEGFAFHKDASQVDHHNHDFLVSKLSAHEKHTMESFYEAYGITGVTLETNQDVYYRSLDVIGSSDWLAANESISPSECLEMAKWFKAYENNWSQHEHIEQLASNINLPIYGKSLHSFDSVVERIVEVVEQHKWYTETHTKILLSALTWNREYSSSIHLLTGNERIEAEHWLLTKFKGGGPPPSVPINLICNFICESKKNAEGQMTDCFICYGVDNKNIKEDIIQSLAKNLVTNWNHERDIDRGKDYDQAILEGIEVSDNLLFFISPYSCASEYCQKELAYAISLNKRIIPLLIYPTPTEDIPEAIRNIQHIDFTDNVKESDYDSDIDDILHIINKNEEYHYDHKVLLTQALKWKEASYIDAFLLRGFNLENADTWLSANVRRKEFPPLQLHHEFITASAAKVGELNSEIFISYSRKDGDFARRLNLAFQKAEKTTWFDQESISTGVDFEKEILKGIKNSDNFLFLISPDSVTSPYCENEVEHALKLNKKVITLVVRETPDHLVPQGLQTIHRADYTKQGFDGSFKELLKAINLDRVHVQMHTALQGRAMEWKEKGESEDYLLNGTACETAKEWLNSWQEAPKIPHPTDAQKAYIQQSIIAIENAKAAERERQKELEKALELAEKARSEAEVERQKAVNEKALADNARKDAETQKEVAVEAKQVAEESKRKADGRLKKIKYGAVALSLLAILAIYAGVTAKLNMNRVLKEQKEAFLAKARSASANEEYEQSLDNYKEALNLSIELGEQKEQIEKINSNIEETQRLAADFNEYLLKIATGDTLKSKGIDYYSRAIQKYDEALDIYPKDSKKVNQKINVTYKALAPAVNEDLERAEQIIENNYVDMYQYAVPALQQAKKLGGASFAERINELKHKIILKLEGLPQNKKNKSILNAAKSL